MKRRSIYSVFFLLFMVLTGCGSKLPEMTYEQQEAIVDYAASTVMKYMRDNNSRLVDLSLYDNKEITTEETETVGMDPVIDTETIDISEDGNQLSILEVLHLSDMQLQFTDYKVLDTYPSKESDNPYFTLDASKGKKLLVLSFTLQNLLQDNKDVDLISVAPSFYVTINDTIKKNVLSTMLLDDLGTYRGELPASGEVNLVLIVELEEENTTAIDQMKLTVSTDVGKTTIPLQ